MVELKVGQYITDKYGYITKILNIDETGILVELIKTDEDGIENLGMKRNFIKDHIERCVFTTKTMKILKGYNTKLYKVINNEK